MPAERQTEIKLNHQSGSFWLQIFSAIFESLIRRLEESSLRAKFHWNFIAFAGRIQKL